MLLVATSANAGALASPRHSGSPVSPAPQAGVLDQPTISASAARQMSLLVDRKKNRSATQQKIQSRLLLARDTFYNRLEPELASLRTSVATAKGRPDTPIVDIGFDANEFHAVLKALDHQPNVEVLAALPAGIRAAIRFDDLESVATVPVIHWIRAASQAATSARAPRPTPPPAANASPASGFGARAAKVRTRLGNLLGATSAAQKRDAPSIVNVSQGDVAHRAVDGRNVFGVNGAGVKIGVLSDGVDSLATAQATGDLPPTVTVLSGQAGSGDEGTAMLEIVHDLAPGASLYFASAFSSDAQFAQNILDLRAAGCDIIVDDVVYFAESPFRDGGNTPLTLIANAVQTVTASGAMYFSSAGNEGNENDGTSGVWEGQFVASTGSIGVLTGAGPLHTFGGAATNTSDQCTSTANTTVLTWDNPIGTSSDDYDFYIMDSSLTTIFDASTDTQDGTGGDDFPLEITGSIFTNERAVVALFSGSSRYLRFQAFRGQLSLNTPSATFGHSTVANAFGVAAVDVATAMGGPFVGGSTNPVETFSSDGPRRLFTQANGTPFPGGFVDRQKPDIAAADGVATSPPGFNPFFGTSAAAPHAAAIAGLLKSSNPSLTPAQIRGFLTSTALDIETPGTDRDSGAGIVMAYDALLASGATPMPFLSLQTSTPYEVSGNGSGFFDPCERVGLTVALGNVGGATATGVSGTLTSNTAGVTVVAGSSTYADIPAGASGSNAQPLTVDLGPSVVCGTAVRLLLNVTYGPGSHSEAVPVSFLIGRPGTPVTFSFTGPPVPIPDSTGANIPGTTVMADLTVSGVPPAMFGVKVRIDGTSCNANAGSTTVGIDHTFVGDLVVALQSPTGTEVTAINRIPNDGGGNSGNNFCQTLLDDGASTSIQSQTPAAAPFTGSYKPANALSSFAGEDPNGTWHLKATDYFVGDTGNIRAWSLIVTPAICDPVPLTITCPANVAVDAGAGLCSAVVAFTTPMATSACATVTCAPASDTAFPVGTTTVTCTASDAMMNTALCSFTVTVNDTQPPSITCPADVTTTADTMTGATVSYAAPAATDNCPSVVTACAPASGSLFPIGVTTVTCTATDAASNVANCSFTVSVSTPFTNCYVDDATGDALSIVANTASPFYGAWRYHVAATGEVLTGSAEYLVYYPNRSLIAYDHDSPSARMDITVNVSARTATATVKNLVTRVQHTLRDRNITNDPACM